MEKDWLAKQLETRTEFSVDEIEQCGLPDEIPTDSFIRTPDGKSVCVCVYVRVNVCESKREYLCVCVYVRVNVCHGVSKREYLCVCVYVCV